VARIFVGDDTMLLSLRLRSGTRSFLLVKPARVGQTAPMERVTGIGGIFLRARDGEALRAWYAEHLGVDMGEWGGKQFAWTTGGSTTWAVFDADAEHLGEPTQSFMVNYRVADLDAMLAQLRTAGVKVSDEVSDTDFGRFGWAHDIEGNRFELWQPPAGE
jgi:predicted enzyme related to lactoylglutathione lyase